MKTTYCKTILACIILVIFSGTGSANVNKNVLMDKAYTCPVTVTFCVPGAGSGVVIEIIYYDTNCNGSLFTRITTGSNGCASYMFSGTECAATYCAYVLCDESPGDPTSFVPNNLPSPYTIQVNNCFK
jgi:hypothetical protein